MKRVLLADDEHSSIEIIRYFIDKNNLLLDVVGEASDGEETVRLVKDLKPDILFLDIQMPVMSGLLVMETLKREYHREITIIVISAYESFEYVQHALRLNAKDYLTKPLLYDQFCETMARVLGYRYTDNPTFNAFLEYIDEKYMEDASLTECAAQLATSESNIKRMLKKYVQMSFSDYRNSVRINKSIEMLSEGVPIKDAAVNSGFNNLNYYYRVFRDRTGITPKQYILNELGDK